MRTWLLALAASARPAAAAAPCTAQNPSGKLHAGQCRRRRQRQPRHAQGRRCRRLFHRRANTSPATPQFTQPATRASTFRFASAEHKALFDQDPQHYLPQYGGYCANGIAYGIPWGGDADTWKIIDGKLYIFGGQGSKDAFELDEKGNLALAENYWKDEVAGNNSFIQRVKRLVLRVPHYKSGEELAQAVAKAKGAAR